MWKRNTKCSRLTCSSACVSGYPTSEMNKNNLFHCRMPKALVCKAHIQTTKSCFLNRSQIYEDSVDLKKQDGAHEPECKHICQTTVYRKRHSRLDYLFHIPVRCWTSCAGDSTTKAACAGDFTTKLRLRHEGSSFCIQIKHWRKGSGRSTSRKKQWHCPKISKDTLVGHSCGTLL